MLMEKLRQGAGGWVAKIFLGLLILSFGVWGIADVFRGIGAADVAVIGSTKIGTEDFRRLYTERLQQLSRQLGRGISPDQSRLLGLDRQILGEMLAENAFDEKARQLGLAIDDATLSRRIQADPNFRGPGGNFDPTYFQAVLRNNGFTEARYVAAERRLLVRQQIARALGGEIAAPAVLREAVRRHEREERNVEFVTLAPRDAGEIPAPTPEQVAAYFEKNKARYQVPERRTVTYALLDRNLLRQRVSATDEELRAYYNDHLDQYRIQNRARVSHILFRTIGKTEAEVQEIRKKAEEVLQKAKRGAKFEELAKQNSEDTTKDKGGDLGWVVQGQTVPEFERTAFSLPKGAISDLVETQYGLHIIKVVDREMARTQSFEEVRASILPIVENAKVERELEQQQRKLADAVRLSSRRAVADIAREFRLTVRETPPLQPGGPVGEFGVQQELMDEIFRLPAGQTSNPILIERGFVILSVKEIQPAHQGTLAEVRSRVEADYRREKAAELAKSLAEDLARRASSEGLPAAAKTLRLDLKTTDAFARNGTVNGVGSGRQLAAAFGLGVGQTSDPQLLDANWILYRVLSREAAKPEELAQQRKAVEQSLLQSKRSMAYESFRTALQERTQRQGILKFNVENLRRLTTGS